MNRHYVIAKLKMGIEAIEQAAYEMMPDDGFKELFDVADKLKAKLEELEGQNPRET